MANNKYKIYELNISEWTSEMELNHDYIKVFGDKVYFLSKAEEKAEVATELPEAVESWAAVCEASLLMRENNMKAQKNLKKAKAQLEKDFKAELDKISLENEETS